MTREEVLAMVPGSEMDAIVAEKVMGWRIINGPWSGHEYWEDENLHIPCEVAKFKPSTEISAAWQIFDKFDDIVVRKYETITGEFRYVCSIVNENIYSADAEDTAELAICRAALLYTLKVEHQEGAREC